MCAESKNLYKKKPHTGNTRPSSPCVIKEYLYYTISWASTMGGVNTISPCLEGQKRFKKRGPERWRTVITVKNGQYGQNRTKTGQKKSTIVKNGQKRLKKNGVRKVYQGVRKVYHGVSEVYHGVRKIYHGVRKGTMVLEMYTMVLGRCTMVLGRSTMVTGRSTMVSGRSAMAMEGLVCSRAFQKHITLMGQRLYITPLIHAPPGPQ